MNELSPTSSKFQNCVAVIGLGYAGLPLAVGFGQHVKTIGFDIDPARISQLRQGSDSGALAAQVETVLAEHPDKVQAFLAGKEKLIGFFVGQVMRATGGKANPRMVNELALKKLETLR